MATERGSPGNLELSITDDGDVDDVCAKLYALDDFVAAYQQVTVGGPKSHHVGVSLRQRSDAFLTPGFSTSASSSAPRVLVKIIAAHGLPARGWDGASDPHCSCGIPGKPKSYFETWPDVGAYRTQVFGDMLTTTWDHAREVVDYSVDDPLEFGVWIRGARGKVQLLGEKTIFSCEFWPGGFNGDIYLETPLQLDLLRSSRMELADIPKSSTRLQLQIQVLGGPTITEALPSPSSPPPGDSPSIGEPFAEVQTMRIRITILGMQDDEMLFADPVCTYEVRGKPKSRFQVRVHDAWSSGYEVNNCHKGDVLRFMIRESSATARPLIGKLELTGHIVLTDEDFDGKITLRDVLRTKTVLLEVLVEVLSDLWSGVPQELEQEAAHTRPANHPTGEARRSRASRHSQGARLIFYRDGLGESRVELRQANKKSQKKKRIVLNILGANDLRKPYRFQLADVNCTYCKCEVAGAEPPAHVTPTVYRTLRPEWNHRVEFEYPESSKPDLHFSVYDVDAKGDHDLVGKALLVHTDFDLDGFNGHLPLSLKHPDDVSREEEPTLQVFVRLEAVQGPPAADKDIDSELLGRSDLESACAAFNSSLGTALQKISTAGVRMSDSLSCIRELLDALRCHASASSRERQELLDDTKQLQGETLQIHRTEEIEDYVIGDSLEFKVWDRNSLSTLGHAYLPPQRVYPNGFAGTLELSAPADMSELVEECMASGPLRLKICVAVDVQDMLASDAKLDGGQDQSKKFKDDKAPWTTQPEIALKNRTTRPHEQRQASRIHVTIESIRVPASQDFRLDVACCCEIAGKPRSSFQVSAMQNVLELQGTSMASHSPLLPMRAKKLEEGELVTVTQRCTTTSGVSHFHIMKPDFWVAVQSQIAQAVLVEVTITNGNWWYQILTENGFKPRLSCTVAVAAAGPKQFNAGEYVRVIVKVQTSTVTFLKLGPSGDPVKSDAGDSTKSNTGDFEIFDQDDDLWIFDQQHGEPLVACQFDLEAPRLELRASTRSNLGFSSSYEDPGLHIIKQVNPDGWAAEHGVPEGGLIVAVDGEDATYLSHEELQNRLEKQRPLHLSICPSLQSSVLEPSKHTTARSLPLHPTPGFWTYLVQEPRGIFLNAPPPLRASERAA